MQTKSIVVTVKQDGSVEVEAIGFKGNACEKATEAIEKALGIEAAPRKRKPEYYTTATQQQRA